jgi:hypothetical protein
MRTALRALLGMASLVAGTIFLITIPKTSMVTFPLSNEELGGIIFLAIWLFFSVASKIGMIADSKAKLTNWIAITAWGIFGIALIAMAFGTNVQPVYLSRNSTILTASFLFGWMLVDLFDLMFLRPVPTPN